MKIAKSTSFVLLLTALISSSSIQVMAQQNQSKLATPIENVDKVNGNAVIERLSAQKKSRKNGNASKAEYIINRNNLTIITFNGLEYFVKNNRVIGIQGLELSEEVLDQITDKLVLLDKVQHDYSERAATEYDNRLFLLSLKMLSSTTRDIAALAKAENPSLNVENNIAKMRLPNVDRALENQATQTLVQLNK
ncbi:hypothetical protein [Pedobacter jeongneungensis]|uniref:hypothetical protein n=1 Tax=Pedobacter jeongneungensis TaxID=947309 RepID=UPI00046893A9|nr:hypothetical protein [Pedobacter jeongneungensis]